MTLKVDVETVDPLRRRLAVEVPAEEVSTELEKAYVDLGRAAKVPGFRPGRVPRPVLERMFGDRVRAEVFGKLIQQSYSEAIEGQQLPVVGQPEIVTEQAQPGAALRYSATVEVKPDVVVENYAGLEIERPLLPISEADVNAALERLRQSLAQLHPISDRQQPQVGDVVTLDYDARIDGRLMGRGENRDVEIGLNGFPPEFDQRLLSASVGDDLEFSANYAADHPVTDVAGKTVQFHVHLHRLSRKEVPTLDDEFAKDHGESSTLVELRQRVRGQLEAAAARRADEAVRGAALTALSKDRDVPVPHALIERRTQALIEDVWHEWQQQRITPKNESEAIARLREELEPRAREQVKIGLLLEAIARQEHIDVTDDEVETRIAALANDAGAAADRVRAAYRDAEARRQLRARLLQARAVDVVVERARITTVHATADASANVAEAAESR